MRDQIVLVGEKIAFVRNGSEVACLKYSTPKDSAKDRNISIDMVYVSPSFRRKGVATKLINYFLQRFQSRVWISLWTSKEAEGDKSWKLYKKLGFTQMAYQRDYYTQGIGTRLFVKRLRRSATLPFCPCFITTPHLLSLKLLIRPLDKPHKFVPAGNYRLCE
ncbi:MAG: hypothetical protein UW69_C0043G0004 [Microgenomates group bacterium GW2011_GWA2_44_7]|nr:MAG: hypothetical protein UW69_C0043G0004 [Microgenomates group bacterium GW2011_GWA2_44_7]